MTSVQPEGDAAKEARLLAVRRRPPVASLPMLLLLLLAHFFSSSSASAATTPPSSSSSSGRPPRRPSSRRILVAGSLNADTFLPVARLPAEGENLCVPEGEKVEVDVPGGKGLNQAVACARLSSSARREDAAATAQGGSPAAGDDEEEEQAGKDPEEGPPASVRVSFLGQFGNDPAVASILRSALEDAGVDVSPCGTCPDAPSGRGYVFRSRDSGKVSAVISGGSNVAGWGEGWGEAERRALLAPAPAAASSGDGEDEAGGGEGGGDGNGNGGGDGETKEEGEVTTAYLDSLLRSEDGAAASCLLLQREIPERVNRVLALRASRLGIRVIQDVGGDDRPMDGRMMGLCDYLVPNESELIRLVRRCRDEWRGKVRRLRAQEEEEGEAEGEGEGGADGGATGAAAAPSAGGENFAAAAAATSASEAAQGEGEGEGGAPEPTPAEELSRSRSHPYGDDPALSPDLVSHLDHVVQAARLLQSYCSAKAVLVTLGSSGSILIPPLDDAEASPPLYCRACTLPPSAAVVDETGAGDCYRAGFAVALSEGRFPIAAMRFASAAGALAVTRRGAATSVPDREEAEALCRAEFGENWDREEEEEEEEAGAEEAEAEEEGGRFSVIAGFLRGVARWFGPHRGEKAEAEAVPRGGASRRSDAKDDDDEGDSGDDEPFPFLFGSRLNSMKDRPDLCPPGRPPRGVRDWVRRQSAVRGLGCVDFNYPQHFDEWGPREAREALDEAGLRAGAVCLRYPSKFARGAMNHPDPDVRREAIELTLAAARAAEVLGCDEVVVWSAYDGYDYPFQVDYDAKWTELVEAFRECCDAHPEIRWSVEYKPTDENTRFFTVPSTGAAILLVREVDRPNMGLTLDVGHMLMAGENPGQSIAMVGQLLGGDRLFGIQLNDGYTRLAAEDGMMFGSVHPTMALEIMYQLRRVGFDGHLYFDTFPQRTDPVKEAEWNIDRAKMLWKAAGRMDGLGVRGAMEEHDALGALRAAEEALGMRRGP